jgi:flagellar protein FlaG
MTTDITGSARIQSQSAAAMRAQESAGARPTPVASVVEKKTPPKTETQPLSKERQDALNETVERLNEQMKSHMSFSIDKTTDRTVIQVEDVKTGEVIRQIPNETVLRVSHNLEKVKGLLLDEKR